MVVPPGVRHLPELLSVTELTGVLIGVREIFGLPVILTNIDFIKQINIYQKLNNMTDFSTNYPLIKFIEQQ